MTLVPMTFFGLALLDRAVYGYGRGRVKQKMGGAVSQMGGAVSQMGGAVSQMSIHKPLLTSSIKNF